MNEAKILIRDVFNHELHKFDSCHVPSVGDTIRWQDGDGIYSVLCRFWDTGPYGPSFPLVTLTVRKE